MNREHAAELIPAFVADALEPDDRVLVEALLVVDPDAARRAERLGELFELAGERAADDADAQREGWEALVARLPERQGPAGQDGPERPAGPEQLPNVLDGRYLLLEELGRNGLGALFRGVDQETGATVAVRIYLGIQDSPRWRARFERELAPATRLDHPNLLTPMRWGVVENLPYSVFPFLAAGGDLQELVERSPGPWEPSRATQLITQAGRGLAAAHRSGVLHRDVSPRHLWLEPDGRVRVSGFEGGRFVQDEARTSLTGCGAALGTPFYLAPEVASGKPVDERADVYALGQILYELLTGRLAFRGRTMVEVYQAKLEGRLEDPCRLAPSLDPGYREVLGKALATDPDQRYAYVELFLAELEAVGRGEAVAPAPAPPWDLRPVKRGRLALGLALGILLALILWWLGT